MKIIISTAFSWLCFTIATMLLCFVALAQSNHITEIIPLKTSDSANNAHHEHLPDNGEVSYPELFLFDAPHQKTSPDQGRTQIPAHVSLPDETQIRKSLAHRNNYKKQFNRLERVIAIVIDDLGINQRRSLKAINLQGVYTLSFLTYGKNLRKLTGKAVKNGQEVFIHQGAAPLSLSEDPGPNALRLDMDEATIRRQIKRAIRAVPHAKGINNHMGSQFTQWTEGVKIMVEETHNNNLIYLDSFTHRASQAFYQASLHDYPALGRDVFLDGNNDIKAIAAQLEKTRKIADRRGFAIAIGHPLKHTLALLPDWQKTLKQQGYEFVTISVLWQKLTANEAKKQKNTGQESEAQHYPNEIKRKTSPYQHGDGATKNE